MSDKRSCFNCVHGVIEKGWHGSFYEPPTPDTADCTNKNVDWDSLEEKDSEHEFMEEKLPLFCNGYEPKMVEKCCECERTLNVPLYEINHFTESEQPLCGKECYTKWYDKFYSQFVD